MDHSSTTKTVTEFPLSIRMMSGDILQMSINPTHPLSSLTRLFITQFGYNPKLHNRLAFYSDVSGDEPVRLFSQDPELSWLDCYPNDTIPKIVYLIIVAEDDSDDPKKVSLLRNILRSKRLTTTLTDDEIMNHYKNWYLHYQPSENSNRYRIMTDFALAHPEYFHPYSLEELEVFQKRLEDVAEKYRECEAMKKERQSELEYYSDVWRFLMHQRGELSAIARKEQYDPNFHEKKERIRHIFIENAIRDPTGMSWDYGVYHNYLTPFEMHELGVRSAVIVCDCPTRKMDHIQCLNRKKCSGFIRSKKSWKLYQEHVEKHQCSVEDAIQCFFKEEVRLICIIRQYQAEMVELDKEKETLLHNLKSSYEK